MTFVSSPAQTSWRSTSPPHECPMRLPGDRWRALNFVSSLMIKPLRLNCEKASQTGGCWLVNCGPSSSAAPNKSPRPQLRVPPLPNRPYRMGVVVQLPPLGSSVRGATIFYLRGPIGWSNFSGSPRSDSRRLGAGDILERTGAARRAKGSTPGYCSGSNPTCRSLTNSGLWLDFSRRPAPRPRG